MKIACLIKALSSNYAKNLVNDGEIKFSKIKSWIMWPSDGRGDICEGAYSIKSIFSNDEIIERKNGLCDINNGYVIYRDKRIYNCWCCCFYSINIEDNRMDYKGNAYMDGVVKNTFFADFKEDKSSICIIKPNLFFEKLIKYLTKQGISNNDIYIGKINYISVDRNYYILHFPKELFCKRKKYEYQQEFRIVIDNSRRKYDSILKNGVIKIGNLSSCIEIHDYYLDEMPFLIQGGLMQFKLPPSEKITYELTNFDEIKAIYNQAKNNYYSPAIKTLEEREKIMLEMKKRVRELGYEEKILDE